MARRQGSRPDVRISRGPGAVSNIPPANRRPVRRPSPPDVAPDAPVERQRPPVVRPAPPRPPRPAYGEGATSLPTPLTVPSRAVTGTPTENAARAPIIARSGATRTREAGLRLFGDYSYVKRDLRRIAVLTISALVLLVVLSFLLPLWLK